MKYIIYFVLPDGRRVLSTRPEHAFLVEEDAANLVRALNENLCRAFDYGYEAVTDRADEEEMYSFTHPHQAASLTGAD